jgi:hypothetical protein
LGVPKGPQSPKRSATAERKEKARAIRRKRAIYLWAEEEELLFMMKFFEKVALKLGKPDTLAELDIGRKL